ncbi:hypothetical protein FS837_011570 [Tulasnella sp. UAMH 9824]|nr:hypothetical protein FS837_011570 [Tulasnella sp. UAMH 9824]
MPQSTVDQSVPLATSSEDTSEGPRGPRICPQFAYELSLLKNFKHENVIELLGFVEDLEQGIAWIVLPWAPNGHVGEFVRSHNWAIPERLSLLNILVNASYYAVITDFGSARKLETHTRTETEDIVQTSEPPSNKTTDQNEGSPQVQLEESGMFITLTARGYTYRWAAPELVVAEQFSLATDIWAFGWICWEIMTGEIPFSDLPSCDNVLARVVTGKLPSITTHAQIAQVQAMCAIMARCWSMNPAQRPNALECKHEVQWMHWSPPSPQNASTAPEKYSAKLQSAIAIIHLDSGRPCEALTYAEAEELYSEAREMYDRIGDERGIAEVVWRLGDAYIPREQYDKAETFYNEALEIWARVVDDRGVKNATKSLADLKFRRGEYEKMELLLEELLKLSVRTGDKNDAAEAVLGLGKRCSKCEARCRNHEQYFTWARAMYAKLGNQIGVATALLEQGKAHQERGEYVEAETLCQEAREIGIQAGKKPTVGDAARALGEIYRSLEEYDKAEQFYTEALDIYNCLGYELRVAEVIFALGANNHHKAESSYRKAREMWKIVGDDVRASNATWMLGEIHRMRNEYAEAKLRYLESIDIPNSDESLAKLFASSMAMGAVHRGLKEYGEAELAYTKAREAATQLEDEVYIAHAALDLGETLYLRDAYMEAIPFYLEARDIFTRTGIQIHIAEAARGLGHIHRRLNDNIAAEAFYTESLEVYRKLGDREDVAQALSSLAEFISALKQEKKP